jgi:hypothetical protein
MYQYNDNGSFELRIWDDYKWCERLHKFIGKKAVATQKLISHHCKKQLKLFFLILYESSIYTPFVALHTSRRYSTSCNRCSYSIFQVAQGYRHWRNVNLIFHKAPQEKGEGGSYLEIAEARKWTPLGRSIAQATAYSRMLSSHCGCVVALRHVEKRYLVCLEVAGALTATATYHCR